MSDVILSDGTEITFDLSKLTIGEFRTLTSGAHSEAEDDAIMSKVAGIPAEQITNLTFIDYRKMAKAFFEKARGPIDPNS